MKPLHIFIATSLLLGCPLKSFAQESQTAYNFLRLPQSAHAAALGGDNISLVDDDAMLAQHNPALLYNVSNKTLALGYMNYMEGVQTAGAAFNMHWGERASWGVNAQYMNYGTMTETTYDWHELGTFSSKEVAVAGLLAYELGRGFVGGITTRFVSSHIGRYNALAAAVDLGINYYNERKNLSLSVVVRSLGGQLKAFEDDFERMPTDLQIGFTHRLHGAPLRFSVTAVRLNDWEVHGLGNHLVVGADVLLGDAVYLSAGYNALRAKEMKIDLGDDGSSAHGAGLSFGAGLTLKRIKAQASYAKYHVSSHALLLNFSYTL
jgi:hypothetical protein